MNDVQESERHPPFLVTGIAGIFVVLAIAAALVAGFTRAYGTDFYLLWVGTFFMCATPFQIMMAVVWRHEIPAPVARMAQPLKGLTLTAMFLLAGVILMPTLLYTVGQGVLTPMFVHYVIQSVGVGLLVIIIFGGWPVTKLTDNNILLGVGIVIYCYLLNFVLFKLFYHYNFFEGAPFYTAALDPGGLFNGITALTFAVTAVAMVMVVIMFEMWPVSKLVQPDNQPVFGVLGTVYILVISAAVYYLFVAVIGMEPMDFMVKGPVCVIFGAFLVDNMMQFQLFAGMPQPAKGIAKSAVCLIAAAGMYQLYRAVLPLFVGSDLSVGPEGGYAQEVWIATAMLGITFPVINIVSGAFEFWPVRREERAELQAK